MVNLLAESTPQNLLLQKDTALCKICIYENQDYRWLTFNDQAIQSVMSNVNTYSVVTPVNQSMLLLLLWPEKTLSVLNLGLGGASIERALLTQDNIKLTSVEINTDIIELAREYFLLDDKHPVYNDAAEDYIAHCHEQFDIVLIDIFGGEQHANCLHDNLFWQNVKKLLCGQQQIFINFHAQSSQSLHDVLTILRQYFPYIAIIEFTNFTNLTLVASLSDLGNISITNIKKSKLLNHLTPTLSTTIKEIFYLDIPA